MKPVLNPTTGKLDMVQDISGCELLDGTNQPATASKEIQAVAPETKWTTTGDSHYSRIVREATDTVTLKNEIAATVSDYSVDVDDRLAEYVLATTLGNWGANFGAGTFEVYFKNSYSATNATFSGIYNAGTTMVFHISSNRDSSGYALGKMRFYFRSNNAKILEASLTNAASEMNDGAWHRLSVSWNFSGTPTIAAYIDGTSKAITYASQQTGGTFANFAYPLVLGGLNVSGSISGFGGIISDFRIWTTVRDAGEISANWNTRLVGNEAGLYAYWKLNDNSGVTAVDITGGYDGTLSGGASWVQDSPTCYATSGTSEVDVLKNDTETTLGNSSQDTVINGANAEINSSGTNDLTSTGITTIDASITKINVSGTEVGQIGGSSANDYLILGGTTILDGGVGTSLPSKYSLHGWSTNLPTLSISAPNVTTQPAFSVRDVPLSTDTNSGKAFQFLVTEETYARGMFYSDGKYGLGGGSATRDVYISRPAANYLRISSDSTTGAGYLQVTGRSFFGGTTNPTANVHLAAGTASASTAPLKFTTGVLLTNPEATIATGTARKELTLNDIALTSGRVPFVTTNGRLTDDADLTFATDTLTATKIVGSTSIKSASYLASDDTAGATETNTGIPYALEAKDGLVTSVSKQTPVADGTYTVGKGAVTDGTITITNGVITAIQEASDV